MKLKQHLIALSCLLVFTCQTDTTDQPEEKIIDHTENLRTARTDDGYGPYEHKLQWAAFITAKVFMHYPDARREVRTFIGNETVIPMDKLIGRSSETPIFDNAFKYELDVYFDLDGRTELEEETPPGNIRVCCPRPGTIAELISMYIDHLTLRNCTELYFPHETLNRAGDRFDEISSTAHPMTNAPFNYGFIRHPERRVFADGSSGYTNQEQVDIRYVMRDHPFTIVVRPVRNPREPDCDYLEYDVNDFTDFLNLRN